VSSADDARADRVADELRAAGLAVTDRYHEDAVVVSMGGDGSILYNARRFGEPTVLPVVTGDSAGNKIEVEPAGLVDRVRELEAGVEGEDYRVERHRKLVATVDGEEVGGEFGALNDVHLHHGSPVRSAKFRAAVREDGHVVFGAQRVIGDGILVATPFGSTGYYRSISGGTFTSGIGVAFNNVHRPTDAPTAITCSPGPVVELSVHPVGHGENAVLVRDDDPECYELAPGRTVRIGLSDRSVGIVRFGD